MSTRSPTPDWRAVPMRNTLREIRSLLGIAAVLGAGAEVAQLMPAELHVFRHGKSCVLRTIFNPLLPAVP